MARSYVLLGACCWAAVVARAALAFAPLPLSGGGTTTTRGSFVQNHAVSALSQSQAQLGRTILSMTAGGKVLVSGLLQSTEKADQLVFDVLHAQGVWDSIVAFSDEAAFARKRLISRKARYSGLSDKLEFDEGDVYDSTSMRAKLDGCDAWLCFNCESGKLKQQLDVAVAAGIKRLVITSTLPAEEVVSMGLKGMLEASGIDYTFMRMGTLVDGKEGGNIMATASTEALPVEEIVRDEAVRFAAEAFQMVNASKVDFSFGGGDEVSKAYLRQLREEGVPRREELSLLIDGGLVAFRLNKSEEIAARLREENKTPEEREAERLEREKVDMLTEEQEQERAKARISKIREGKVRDEIEKMLHNEWNTKRWRGQTSLLEEEYIQVPENIEKAKKAAYKRIDILNNWSHIFGTHDLYEEPLVEIKAKSEEETANEDDDEELEVEVDVTEEPVADEPVVDSA